MAVSPNPRKGMRMAALGGTIDPNTIPPDDRSFDPIPAGTQAIAHVTESEVKQTKNGGTMAVLRWDVLDGPYKGRVIWDNVNLRNANPKAAEIGQRHMSSIAVATGAGAVTDTVQIHHKPCLVKIGIEKQEGYEPKNVIKGVKPPTAAAPAGPVGGKPAAPAVASWGAPAKAAQPQPGGVPWGGQAATPDNAAKAPF